MSGSAARRLALTLGAVVVFAFTACRAAPTPVWDSGSGVPRPTCVQWRVRGKAQGHSLSCESRSACDLLGWYGLAVDEDEFFQGLPRSSNPEEGFVGSVDDPGGGLPPAGYGVYEEPVAARLRAYGVEARARRGADLPWLFDQLAQGRPVIVWAISRFDAPPPVTLLDLRGRAFLAAPGEHTFLAVGYDGRRLTLLDPATGAEKEVAASRFLASWSVLGRRAVVVDTSHVPGGGP